MVSWNYFNDKMLEVFGRNIDNFDELYFSVKKERDFDEFTELNDLEALEYLGELKSFEGILYIITDICYRENYGPFEINADEIKYFVENFSVKYGESFYSTDILIVSFIKKMYWVLFHEGKCWLTIL